METLDLHGLRHHQVELLVENFVLINEMPVKIITGNSPTMKQIVQSVLDRHDFASYVESDWNLGSIIVHES
jgi:hypothetical protein